MADVYKKKCIISFGRRCVLKFAIDKKTKEPEITLLENIGYDPGSGFQNISASVPVRYRL